MSIELRDKMLIDEPHNRKDGHWAAYLFINRIRLDRRGHKKRTRDVVEIVLPTREELDTAVAKYADRPDVVMVDENDCEIQPAEGNQ